MGEYEAPYRVIVGLFGRWIIVSKRDGGLAWSGTCWVAHEDGVPEGRAKIANFDSEQDALETAREIWGC